MEIYHITHLDNLSSILKVGGLLANSKLQSSQYTDIAHGSIQDRRARIKVPCAAGGTLHDYVPFYFAPRSPMLYTIHQGNVQGYQDGQEQILHLEIRADRIIEYDQDFAFTFTDGHAVVEYSEFYEEVEALEHVIDWELMNSNYWFDTQEYPDRKRRRQAEFLVYEFCPWDFVTKIAVINERIADYVSKLLDEYNDPTPIYIYPNWYY